MADNGTDQVSLKDLTTGVAGAQQGVGQLTDTMTQLNTALQGIMQSGDLASLKDAMAQHADAAGDAGPGKQPSPVADEGDMGAGAMPGGGSGAAAQAPQAAIKDMMSQLAGSMPQPSAAPPAGAVAEGPAAGTGSMPGGGGDADSISKTLTSISSDLSAITKNADGKNPDAAMNTDMGMGSLAAMKKSEAEELASIKTQMHGGQAAAGQPAAADGMTIMPAGATLQPGKGAPASIMQGGAPAETSDLSKLLASGGEMKPPAAGDKAAPSILNMLAGGDVANPMPGGGLPGSKGADMRGGITPPAYSPGVLATDPGLAMHSKEQHTRKATENALHHNQASVTGNQHRAPSVNVGSLLKELHIKTKGGKSSANKDIKKMIITTLQEAVNQTDIR